MFRCVTMTDHDLPAPPLDDDRIARHQTMVIIRQGRNRLAVTGTALFELGQMLGIQTVLAELFDHEAGAVATHFIPDDMGGQEFAHAHP
ncbi:hypothetical protein SDC9_209018 [bioreactor metagenome]|uniref:Uncharacterized protein n=1 Tax=bioreactor metagenome TaxID=1076179 RepID=A0A645JNW7_9ZZZZ